MVGRTSGRDQGAVSDCNYPDETLLDVPEQGWQKLTEEEVEPGGRVP